MTSAPRQRVFGNDSIGISIIIELRADDFATVAQHPQQYHFVSRSLHLFIQFGPCTPQHANWQPHRSSYRARPELSSIG